METKRFAIGSRGTAAVLAVLVMIASPHAVAAEESTEQVPAAEAIDFSDADPVIADPEVFERNPVLSGIHLGLGWAAIVTGLAAGILNPEVVEDDIHETLGITAAVLSAGTMVFGIAAHHGEVGPKFRLSANNVHALIGAAGGVMMMAAPFLAPSDAHQLVGEAGALMMGASVVWKIMF